MPAQINHESSESLVDCLGVVRCTAKAARISRRAKSGCVGEWDGWGRISVDGSGHYNPDRNEDPWGRTKSPHGGAKREKACRTQGRSTGGNSQAARRQEANRAVDGKALADRPALKPYRGKPAVRNFREGDGNNGIIEARLAPSPYSTNNWNWGAPLLAAFARSGSVESPKSKWRTPSYLCLSAFFVSLACVSGFFSSFLLSLSPLAACA